MNLLSMKLFVSISKTQNITRTAQEFFITQPVVSRRMQELENELGFRLFDRSHHGVILTREGELLAPVFETAINQLEQGIFSIRSQMLSQPRTVSIAAITPATNTFLPSVIGEFSTLYPDITIQIQRMVPKQIQETVSAGTYDIFISDETDFDLNEDWMSCIVRSDSMGLIVRKSEPCSTPEEALALLRKSLVYLIPEEDSPSTTFHTKKILSRLGCENVPQIEVRPIESIFFNISSGMGVAILPKQVGPLDAFGLKLVSLGIPDQARMAMVWRKDAPEDVQLFTRLLQRKI